ncbi:MAG: metallophosphoesterase [Acidobacteria bacterium]|nr:metallophosphoesterase [Acidobacteriota bacterium]
MKKWLKRIGLGISIILFLFGLFVAYAYFIGPRQWAVVEETLAVPNWNSKLDGFKVVAISDIHAGSNYAPEERLRFVVEQANAQNADLVVLLGDYVSESRFDRNARSKPYGTDRTEIRMPVATIAEILGGLRAKYGVFAVIGNHDEYHNAPKITAEFERSGIRVLENAVTEIDAGGEKIKLWGIEDLWKRREVPVEAFNAIAEKKNIIAITHNPDTLLRAPGEISVMFAGHSHGGQLNWPIFGPIMVVNDKRFTRGHAVVDGKHVYVTSGVGTSVIPFRFRVPPEIAVITLRAE